MKKKWTLVYRFKDSHRLYKDVFGRHSLCDDSGDFPDDADDGPCFLDFDKAIHLERNKDMGDWWAIPIRRKDGSEGICTSTTAQALWLSANFKWRIQYQDKSGMTAFKVSIEEEQKS